MDRNNATIRIGDTVIVKSKVVYYRMPEENKKHFEVNLEGRFTITFVYENRDEARRNFDEFNKQMKEY